MERFFFGTFRYFFFAVSLTFLCSSAFGDSVDCRAPKDALEQSVCCNRFGRDLNYCVKKLEYPKRSENQQLNWEGNQYDYGSEVAGFKKASLSQTDIKGIRIGMSFQEVKEKFKNTLIETKDSKNFPTTQYYSILSWRDLSGVESVNGQKVDPKRRSESFSYGGKPIESLTFIFIDQRLAVIRLAILASKFEPRSEFDRIFLPSLKEKFSSSFSFNMETSLGNDYGKFFNKSHGQGGESPIFGFVYSNSFKRTFSKWMRSMNPVPENLSNADLASYIKSFVAETIYFQPIDLRDVGYDDQGDLFPIALGLKLCHTPMYLLCDESKDETLALICSDGERITFMLSTESSRGAWASTRLSLVEEVKESRKKAEKISKKKRKDDM